MFQIALEKNSEKANFSFTIALALLKRGLEDIICSCCKKFQTAGAPKVLNIVLKVFLQGNKCRFF